MIDFQERAKIMTGRVISGETCASVGNAFGISAGRVMQVVKVELARLIPDVYCKYITEARKRAGAMLCHSPKG